jgi:putative sigma-54 modulation protein
MTKYVFNFRIKLLLGGFMNLSICGHHLDLTPALRDYVAQKLERTKRHFGQVIDVAVVLSIDKLRQKAEINLHVRGKDMHAEAVDHDLYTAIDMLFDKLDRQVSKYKTKIQNHHHLSGKYGLHIEAAGT